MDPLVSCMIVLMLMYAIPIAHALLLLYLLMMQAAKEALMLTCYPHAEEECHSQALKLENTTGHWHHYKTPILHTDLHCH